MAKEKELNAKAEKRLLELSACFFAANGWVEKGRKLVEPNSIRTNMIYDMLQSLNISDITVGNLHRKEMAHLTTPGELCRGPCNL